MEPISIIGNALHIYMLAFSEPDSICSRLMVYCKWLSSSALALNIINNSCRVFISQSGSQASYIKMMAQFDACQVRARCLQRSDCVILVTAAFVTNLACSIPTSYLCHMSICERARIQSGPIRFHQSHSNELMGKCCPVPIKLTMLQRPLGLGGFKYRWCQERKQSAVTSKRKYFCFYKSKVSLLVSMKLALYILGIGSVPNFAVLHTLRVCGCHYLQPCSSHL